MLVHFFNQYLPYPFMQFLVYSSWEEVTKWISDLQIVLEKNYQNHVAKFFVEKAPENNVRINHKCYYKENGKFYELITTREIAEDKVPAELLDMLNKSEGEVDITDYIEKVLKMSIDCEVNE